MRAVAIDNFGHREQLRLVEADVPVPGPREVLIRVAAAGANPVDYKIREGLLRTRLPHQFPIILGWDASGTIEQAGSRCRRFKPGDPVYAYCRKPIIKDGAYAEYIAVDERAVALKPRNLDFAEAASVPLAALTAWQALFDLGKLRRGQRVLVEGGAGGVGHFAVQLARARGARVWATAREENHAFLRDLGAHHVIDYTRDDVPGAIRATCPEGVDLALDTVGGDVQARGAASVRQGGVLVSILAFADPASVQARGVTPRYLFVTPSGAQLRRLAALAGRGRLRPHVSVRLPLSEAARAHALLESRRTRGKIVLDVGG